jgi:hypothetical protein
MLVTEALRCDSGEPCSIRNGLLGAYRREIGPAYVTLGQAYVHWCPPLPTTCGSFEPDTTPVSHKLAVPGVLLATPVRRGSLWSVRLVDRRLPGKVEPAPSVGAQEHHRIGLGAGDSA